MAQKLSIIMPIFNEVATIGEIFEKVYAQGLPAPLTKEIVVVESNSTDGTRAKIQALVEEKKRQTWQGGGAAPEIRLVLQEKPRGKGNAVREGLQSATGDIILIQDGDLEYDVADYPILLQPILDERAKFVLGSRHLSAGNWKIRKFKAAWLLNLGGIFFNTFFNFIYGQSLTDPTTMFKVFHRDCIRGTRFSSDRFDFDYELTAKILRRGYVPLEVPVTYRSRGFEDGKKIRIVRDSISWVWAILKFRFQKMD